MKKVFIATDYDGDCFFFSVKPIYTNGRYSSEGGAEAKLSAYVAEALGIPFPKPGEMIEWPPPLQTAAPESEPPAETLMPITSVSQLKVGDMVRNDKLERKVLAVVDLIVALSSHYNHERLSIWYSLDSLKVWGYQQVVTAPRTISREEARKAMDEGKAVRCVDGDVWYCLSGEKMHIRSGKVTDMRLRWYANINAFDIPEGRYEIVKGGE